MLRIVSFSYLGLPEWGIVTADGAHILRAAELEEALFIPLPRPSPNWWRMVPKVS